MGHIPINVENGELWPALYTWDPVSKKQKYIVLHWSPYLIRQIHGAFHQVKSVCLAET